MAVAEEYRKSFPEGADILPLPAPVPDLSPYGLVGFGYPVHAFNAPEVFIRFLRSLPQGQGRCCFLFKTSGEGLWLNDASSSLACRVLERKGWRILSEGHYVMPYNLVFRTPPRIVWMMQKAMEVRVPLHAALLIRGREEKIKIPFLGRVLSAVLRIEWLYARNQRFHADSRLCTRCGLCASRCPVHAIGMEEGRIVFKKGCSLCMRCAFGCPRNAVRLGLLDPWRVNGTYVPDPAGEEGHEWLYRRYFRRVEKETGIDFWKEGKN